MDDHEQESEARGLPLEHALSETGDRELAFMWLAFAAAAGAGSVVLLLVVDQMALWVYLLLGLLFFVTLVAAFFRIRVWASWSNPQLFLPSSEPLHLGDQVVVRFRRTARGSSDLEGMSMTATVRATEKVRHGAGSRTRIDREEVYQASVAVALEVVGRTVEADLHIDIPLFDAPPTMDLGKNEVIWELWVRMEAPNAPDDDTTFPLVVAPIVAARLQSGGSGR